MDQAGTFNGVDVVGGEDLVAFRPRHLALGGVSSPAKYGKTG